MGYTHYFYRPAVLDKQRFASWASDVQTLLENLPEHSLSAGGYYADEPLLIGAAWGDGTAPVITPTRVAFNGVGDAMQHDDFVIEQEYHPDFESRHAHGWLGDFCKTARKPYDLLVTAALIRLAYWFPEGVDIASDGTEDEWAEGARLCAQVFGIGVVPFADEQDEEEG